jgi:WD repeat-containing protein 32
MEAEVKRKRGYSSLNMLGKREIGQQFLKHDTLTSKYYKHLKMSWNQDEAHGAIFNLEFSPSGKMLVAACEECAILLYDPLSRKCVHRLPNAHEDSVNTICFCDERIFASGSDDCNVALWDTRMLGEHIMELSGHTGWVKSLVYDTNTKMLLSSAFDGTVRMWDINRSPCSEHDASVTMYSDRDVSCMQVTVNKLIISCQNWENSGDIIIIFHNLDLPNFAEDLSGGVPAENENDEVYIRNIPERLSSNSEYIDIPLRIPSFVVHPHGSCLVSRYLTANNDEYTTVHDMQSCFSCGEVPMSN